MLWEKGQPEVGKQQAREHLEKLDLIKSIGIKGVSRGGFKCCNDSNATIICRRTVG